MAMDNFRMSRKALIYLLNLYIVEKSINALGSTASLEPSVKTNLVYNEVISAAKANAK